MATRHEVQVGRAYDPRRRGDGYRVLIDRLWPRGLRRDEAELDAWCKVIAPSTELRAWYGHDPSRFREFARRYRAELQRPAQAEALDHLRAITRRRRLTLLTATREQAISHAAVLVTVLRGS